MLKRTLLFAFVALVSCEKKQTTSRAVPPPPLVLVTPVVKADVPIYVENVAQTEADSTVEIRARVSGFLVDAPFVQGGRVKKGDLLFKIDPKPYEAAIALAEANVAKSEATLARAQAEVGRLKLLIRANAISQQDVDNANAAEKEGVAGVAAAKAVLTTAQLDLSYTNMIAPFDGLIGSRQLDVGNYVSVAGGATLLATVSTTDPMRVSFRVAEMNYLKYQKRFMGNEAAAKEHNDSMVFELILSDGTTYGHRGHFTYVERALDPRTGTLEVVLTFPNPEFLLRPGQFARVRAAAEERKGALLVPHRAVSTVQSAQSVLVVGSDHKVIPRTIKTDGSFGDQLIVKEGLVEGEMLVVEGIQKAAPGSTVTPQPWREQGAAGPKPSTSAVLPLGGSEQSKAAEATSAP